jgi:hypothetical protein
MRLSLIYYKQLAMPILEIIVPNEVAQGTANFELHGVSHSVSMVEASYYEAVCEPVLEQMDRARERRDSLNRDSKKLSLFVPSKYQQASQGDSLIDTTYDAQALAVYKGRRRRCPHHVPIFKAVYPLTIHGWPSHGFLVPRLCIPEKCKDCFAR